MYMAIYNIALWTVLYIEARNVPDSKVSIYIHSFVFNSTLLSQVRVQTVEC